jgi:hypothetical protein
LQHPNIASVHGFKEADDDRSFSVSLDGGTERPSHLDAILNWKPRLDD